MVMGGQVCEQDVLNKCMGFGMRYGMRSRPDVHVGILFNVVSLCSSNG